MFKGKLLSSYGNPQHETSINVDKSGHAIDIAGFRLAAAAGAGTGACSGTCGCDLSLGSRRYGDCLGSGVKFEFAAGKCIIGPFVFEEDNFTKGFAAGLESDRSLDHR